MICREARLHAKLMAGDEGLEPSYPGLESGVLAAERISLQYEEQPKPCPLRELLSTSGL